MKSLEHIIREIREGKGVKGEKSSLEHSIRKVVKGETESSFADRTTKPLDEVVGTLGTDKYQGNEFKSIRTATPHIKPPAGEGSHSQAPENASRQRSIAKEKAGINRVTEGAKSEFAEPIIKGLEDLFRVAPEAKLPAVVNPKKIPAKPKSGVPEVIPPKGAEVPAKVEPKTDTKVEPKTDTKVQTKTEVPGKVDTTTTEPKVKLAEPETKVKLADPADTKVKLADPAVEPKAVTEPKTKLAAPVAEPLAKLAAGSTKPKGAFIPPLPGGGASVPHDIDYTVSHLHRPKISLGHAKAHKKHAMKEENERKQIENMPRKGDRKSIEYVGRKDADPKSTKEKTSRLATIKNVLDEAKKAMVDKKFRPEDGKTKVYDYGDNVLVINPDQRKINLDVDNGEKVSNDNQ